GGRRASRRSSPTASAGPSAAATPATQALRCSSAGPGRHSVVTGKLLSMQEAIAAYVRDGMSVAIEGFTASICFAAGHEIIRQGRRDLTLVRMTPDLIYDQMVAAGTARKLVFSYLGNPGVGPLHCVRRAVERGDPNA